MSHPTENFLISRLQRPSQYPRAISRGVGVAQDQRNRMVCTYLHFICTNQQGLMEVFSCLYASTCICHSQLHARRTVYDDVAVSHSAKMNRRIVLYVYVHGMAEEQVLSDRHCIVIVATEAKPGTRKGGRRLLRCLGVVSFLPAVLFFLSDLHMY